MPSEEQRRERERARVPAGASSRARAARAAARARAVASALPCVFRITWPIRKWSAFSSPARKRGDGGGLLGEHRVDHRARGRRCRRRPRGRARAPARAGSPPRASSSGSSARALAGVTRPVVDQPHQLGERLGRERRGLDLERRARVERRQHVAQHPVGDRLRRAVGARRRLEEVGEARGSPSAAARRRRRARTPARSARAAPRAARAGPRRTRLDAGLVERRAARGPDRGSSGSRPRSP